MNAVPQSLRRRATGIAKILRERPAAVSGALLVLSAVAALALANSPLESLYRSVWDTPFGIGLGEFRLEKAVLLWINDGLMAIFFLLVGLEIKREILEGALSNLRKAALPMAAATGGVLIPAGIYTLVATLGDGDPAGWAVPAATDIAFALGVLALLGPRVPLALKVFLTTVAVVDDVGAILIIAAFFTSQISWSFLGLAGGALVVLVLLNRSGVHRVTPYAIIGVVLWFAILKSGLHATIAGVLLAATIPATRLLRGSELEDEIRSLVTSEGREASGGLAPNSLVHRVRTACDDFESPLVRWEHAIQPAVLFVIVPIFAFANAGVTIGGSEGGGLGTVALAVAAGLLVGKPLGITLFAWLAVRLKLAELPEGLSWKQLHGASWLGGIGFTMSLFIAELALSGSSLGSAKIGLLLASGIAALIGAWLVFRSTKTEEAEPTPNSTG